MTSGTSPLRSKRTLRAVQPVPAVILRASCVREGTPSFWYRLRLVILHRRADKSSAATSRLVPRWHQRCDLPLLRRQVSRCSGGPLTDPRPSEGKPDPGTLDNARRNLRHQCRRTCHRPSAIQAMRRGARAESTSSSLVLRSVQLGPILARAGSRSLDRLIWMRSSSVRPPQIPCASAGPLGESQAFRLHRAASAHLLGFHDLFHISSAESGRTIPDQRTGTRR